MRFIISLILTLTTFVTGLLGGGANATAADGAEPSAVPAAVTAAAALPDGAVSYADMTYERCDAAAFRARTDELCALAEAGDADGAIALYDELYEEYLRIDAMATLAMLRYHADTSDAYWTEEYSEMNAVWEEAYDAMYGAGCALAESPCADAFYEHTDGGSVAYTDYIPLTDEELAGNARELALIDEYYALYDGVYDVTAEVGGETWTLDDLYGRKGDRLANRDYDAYLAAWDTFQRALCETFAPVYIELVGLWKDEAARYGYDSFTDYAYELYYARDYGPDEAQALCDAIKPIARAYYADLYYADIAYAYDEPRPELDADALIDVLGAYLAEIDPELTEPWEAMTERGVYDIAPYASGRLDGGYTTDIAYYGVPFIFCTLEENCYDLATITHEFGHFANYWFCEGAANIVTDVEDLDLCEVHSNGLQALFSSFYGDIYTRGAGTAEYQNLSFMLESVIEGCLYDEFQRRVFAYDGELTAEALNDIYMDVCLDYGIDEEGLSYDASWVYVSHSFEQPLYYFSYAASDLAALRLWDMAQEDFDAAARTYMSILRRGAYGDGYFTVLSDCGLDLFTEDGVAQAVCDPVLDRLTALADSYSVRR